MVFFRHNKRKERDIILGQKYFWTRNARIKPFDTWIFKECRTIYEPRVGSKGVRLRLII